MHISEDISVVPAESWSAGLEAWARARWSEQVIPVDTTMDFAPLGTQRPRAFFEVPVVILVMTRATRRLHRAMFRAVELLRESTYGFRAVLFTDEVSVFEAAEVDWALEHTMPEAQWSQISAQNWLVQASEHLAWAQRQYGASWVLAPETPDQVRAAVARLGAAFVAPEKVRQTAASLAEEELDGLGETMALSSRRVESLRGWWSQLGSGRSTVRVDVGVGDGARLRFVVDRPESAGGAGDAGLLIGPHGAAVESFLGLGRQAGYATVSFEVEEGDAAAVQGGLETAIRAAVEALGAGGPALFVAGAPSNVQRAADRGLDAVVHLGDDGAPHEMLMSYGPSAQFDAERTVEVLSQLTTIHQATA